MAQHRSFLFLTIFAAWALGWCGSPVGLEAADGTVKVFILAGQSNMKHFIRDVLVDQAAAELFPTWRDNFEQWQKVGSDRPYHYFGSAIWFTRIGHVAGEAMLELLKDGDGTAAVPRTPSKHWTNRRVP